MRFKRDDEWLERSYAEFGAIVEELALGLLDLGINPGERVCILANTRPEWSFISFAISAAGGVVVPIYPTSSPEECEWVAGNSGARVVVVEDAGQLAKIERVRERLPELEHTIGIEDGVAALDLEGLRARGRDGGDRAELRRRQEAVQGDDAYTIIYTSGTTGPPKGCVLTHRNAMSVGAMVEELGFVNSDDVSYLYLPLAHVFALTTVLGSVDQGTAVVYFGGDTKNVIPELMASAPTYVPSVPRIFEKLYAIATAKLEQASTEQREQFQRAVKLGVEVRRRQHRGEEVPEQMQERLR